MIPWNTVDGLTMEHLTYWGERLLPALRADLFKIQQTMAQGERTDLTIQDVLSMAYEVQTLSSAIVDLYDSLIDLTKECPRCEGAGKIGSRSQTEEEARLQMVLLARGVDPEWTYIPCPACGGVGRVER